MVVFGVSEEKAEKERREQREAAEWAPGRGSSEWPRRMEEAPRGKRTRKERREEGGDPMTHLTPFLSSKNLTATAIRGYMVPCASARSLSIAAASDFREEARERSEVGTPIPSVTERTKGERRVEKSWREEEERRRTERRTETDRVR